MLHVCSCCLLSTNAIATIHSEFFQVQYILSDGSILVQKEVKKDSNKNNYRRMIVVNQQDLQQATTTTVPVTSTQLPVTQQRVITQQIPSNGNVETKSAIVASSSQQQRGAQQAMTPLGPLTLTAEEYNELMQRRMQKQVVDVESQHRKAQQDAQERAQQERVQQQQQQIHHQQLQEHQTLTMQVQKIVQSLEDDEMKKEEDEEDIEMQLIEPKLEAETTVKIEEGTSSDKPSKSEAENSKNAGRPFTCEQCGKKFLLKHHLTTHARVHSGMQMLTLVSLVISDINSN
jgi:hypothetical protein